MAIEKGTCTGVFVHLEAYKIKIIAGVNAGVETIALWDEEKQHFEDAHESDCVFKLHEVTVLDLA